MASVFLRPLALSGTLSTLHTHKPRFLGRSGVVVGALGRFELFVVHTFNQSGSPIGLPTCRGNALPAFSSSSQVTLFFVTWYLACM
jgi:hypothetical protein